MPVGTYPITLTPGSGVTSWQILYGPPLIISNNAVNSYGNHRERHRACWRSSSPPAPRSTFHATPSTGGTIYAEGAAGFSPVTTGSTESLALGTYGFVAIPAPGYAFTGWSTKTPSTISFTPEHGVYRT